MSLLLALALTASAVYAWRRYNTRRGPSASAGASAAARTRQLRTPLVRLATALGIDTRAEREARNWEEGARGERRAAARLQPLTDAGWWIRYDLALPPGEGSANVDGLAISPAGKPFVLDPKVMHPRFPVTVHAGRVWHGNLDVTRRITSAGKEAAAVSRALGVPVVAIVAIEGARLLGPHKRPATELALGPVRIVPAHRLPAVLQAQAHVPGQRHAEALVATAERVLPPYLGR
ncbi:NERD domain-containing protein [Streptomyces sp. NPDC007346]|uniref:NERD domain-containing protein n=1 Tax=Streptomyces sp. NPDC007346 TaxID=3154682 RepID=UPI00345639D4